MSFDGIFTRAITNELSLALKGGRINKIQQPFPNELLMVIRANGKNHRLLLSIHPSYARVQLTNEVYENPNEPPMFCMLMRKHLEGFILEDISQISLDRMIVFEVKGRNELGDISCKQLIVEIMGRHSNIILVDKDRNMILDSIKHVSFAVNSHRAILPGQPYILPPAQDKVSPFDLNEEAILRTLDFNAGKLDQQLVSSFAGVSPLLAKEVVFQAGIANRVSLPKTFTTMFQKLKNYDYSPAITISKGKESFYLFPLEHLQGETKIFPSLSEMLDRYYFGKAERDRVKQKSSDLLRFMINEKEKNEKKIVKLKATFADAEKANEYQLYGELLTANLYAVTRGMKEVQVINYYDENGATIKIPLDPQKGPSDNAQRYFTKYQKAKTALEIVKQQIEKAEQEVGYFESLLQQVETASPRDIEEIREELIEEGYMKDRRKKQKKSQAKPLLDSYQATDGTEILVGKNNKQNDYLTNKVAARDEIWLHTKDIPGSHVVIRSRTPQEKTIIEAAELAAYFSKARTSSSVPVDFTLVRHVKKPSGAKPGFVIYDHQQTVFVTPTEEIVLQLKK
ncbi:Rqc2 family fibronectin-binding protein [Bacillus sp. 1NLA3E]|uniref:Rqc2 family fibronectin-binding protein n=1 Tax=Bacillus sp. 1NLA3E TaxID=666686 RepID=UPI000247E587|nr:NFACT RNA binding domain-containing protein [Bacillus sp. 1NLA3E]AGK53020.1 Fibronectin-binding A domain-containing protein [Bacillus sp. 1NLA3E]